MNIDYGRIIHRSIELIKKNKWLWVYGLTLAVLSGGSGSGGGGGGNSSSSTRDKKIPEDLPEKASKVLGQTISAISDWFSNVPITTWILLVLIVIISLITGIIVAWIINSWAKGGLIAGLEDADNEKVVTLASTAQRGIKSVKNLILFSLISSGLLFVILVLFILIVVLGYLSLQLVPPMGTVWLFLSIFTFGLSFITVVIILSMVTVYAERLIVLKGYTPWEAWKKGLSLSKGNFLSTIVMAIINTSIGCVGGCLATIAILILLGIPAVLLLLPTIISGQWRLLGIPTFGGLFLLIFIFIQINYLVKAAFILFNYSNWNLLFKEIWEKEKI